VEERLSAPRLADCNIVAPHSQTVLQSLIHVGSEIIDQRSCLKFAIKVHRGYVRMRRVDGYFENVRYVTTK